MNTNKTNKLNMVIAVCTLIATAFICAFGAVNDTLITFGTMGPDKYMDGTTVKDGECYALVWTKTGATFAGLTADGKAVGDDSVVIVFAPLAKGGCCPKTLFQIDTALASKYSDGTFALYLVDTRLANGKLGVDSKGLPIAVNGWGEVKVEGEGEEAAGYAVAVTKKSEVPAGTPQPTITAIKVIGDNVYLTVKNTVPYLQYTAKEVTVGGDVSGAPLSAATQGDADAEITVIAPKKGNSGFYSIARN